MKTYLFDTFNRYKRFSEKLDVKTILCNKSWWVFNDNGDKEIYIFQKDGTLIISIKGRVSYSTWNYISANQSIIITSAQQAYMVIPAFVDGNILALQVDGTNEYAFLINEQKLKELALKTYNDIFDYFQRKEKYVEQELVPIEGKIKVGTNATNDGVGKYDGMDINTQGVIAIVVLGLTMILIMLLSYLHS